MGIYGVDLKTIIKKYMDEEAKIKKETVDKRKGKRVQPKKKVKRISPTLKKGKK